MFCLLSAYRMPKKVEMKGKNTFRFSIIRRKVQTVFKSKALKTALLAELYGGKDAALVAQMVDSVSPLVDPPVQVVAPLPPVDDDVSEDEGYNTSPEVDFEQFDYWALGLNSHLWRIDLYKEGNDGFWTL